MRRRTCLARLNKSFARRISKLEAVAFRISGRSGHDVDQALSFVLIETLTAWSNFVREFYLSCAFLNPKTISGQHVVHANGAVVNERDALIHSILILRAKTITKPRITPFDEPTWREKRTLSSLSQSLALSNNQAIVSGLSYQTGFFDEAHIVRNFYAHRTGDTASKVADLAVRKHGLVLLKHPSELVNVIFLGRTQTLIQEWLGDIRVIGTTICQ